MKLSTHQGVKRILERNLPVWDLNGDGKVSRREVDRFMSDETIQGLDAVTLATLKWTFRKFPEMGKAGVNSSNLFSGRSHHGMTVLDRFQSYQEKLDSSETLFEGGAPNPHSIRQGLHGSCNLLAALTVQAARKPYKLVDAIKAETGGYRVSFSSYDVFVSKPTTVERLTGSQSNGIWANVFEKAMAQRNPKKLKSTGDVYDNLDLGLSADDVIRSLSGCSYTEVFSPVALPDSSFKRRLLKKSEAFPSLLERADEALTRGVEEGRLILAGTSRDPRSGEQTYQAGHAYAITDYDSKTRRVTLRNPWGHTDLRGLESVLEDELDDGTFQATLEGLLKNFSSVCIESADS